MHAKISRGIRYLFRITSCSLRSSRVYQTAGVNRRSVYGIFNECENARDFEFIHSFASGTYIMTKEEKGEEIYRPTAKGFISGRRVYPLPSLIVSTVGGGEPKER